MAQYDPTATGSPLEFDTANGQGNSLVALSSTLLVNAWKGASRGLIQTFSRNAGTGAITAFGSSVELEAGEGISEGLKLIVLDSTHVLAVWHSQFNSKMNTRMFSVDTGTGALTAMGSMVEVASSGTFCPEAVLLDSTHVLFIWGEGGTTTTKARVFSFNTSTGAITGIGTAYSTTTWIRSGTATLFQTNKVLFIGGDSPDDVTCRILSVNLSTWAVTLAADTTIASGITVSTAGAILLDADATAPVFVGIYKNSSGGTTGTILITFSINTSTWAATTLDTEQISTDSGATSNNTIRGLLRIDDTHVLAFFRGDSTDGFARMYEVNASGVITPLGTALEFDTTDGNDNSAVEISSGIYVNAWAGALADGFIQQFTVDLVGSLDVTVSIGSPLAFTASVPAPSVSGGAVVSQGTPPSATFSTPAPAITGGAVVNAGVLTATFSIPTPDVYTPDALVVPSVLTATFSTPAPTIEAQQFVTVSPSPLVATFSTNAPAVAISADIAATVLTATFSIPAPLVGIGAIVDAGVLEATFTTLAVSVSINQEIMAGVLTATFTSPAVTVTAERFVTVAASVLSATFSIVRPRKTGGAWSAQPRETGDWTAQPRTMG